ncbi:MAG TPA: hypothetical protein VG407_14875 [Caulobacteraceae bacterium]|jgi:hypothetical protein|nr:hypothetical protein [Caulobacteraceae bacterium]
MRTELDRLDGLAEAAYAALYDAHESWKVKETWDDASAHFRLAIEEARRLGLADEVERLEKRLVHCREVWDRQFRGVGR